VRLDAFGQQQVQPSVAVVTHSGRRVHATPQDCFLDLPNRRHQRIETDASVKRLPVAEAFCRTASEYVLGQVRKQLHAFLHSIVDSVPLDHRELRVVPRAAFAAAKHPRDLINGGGAGRQQPFHPELRRRLQPEGTADLRLTRIVEQQHRQRIEMPVDHGVDRQHRRLDFQKPAAIKEVAQAPQQACAKRQISRRRRG
jgi:hypothetical protein